MTVRTPVLATVLGPLVAGGGLCRDERPLRRDLTRYISPVPAGGHRLTLTADTGGYPPGELSATARVRVRPWTGADRAGATNRRVS